MSAVGVDIQKAESQKCKGRIFSGVQPSGALHVGNYLGAIRNWVDMQANYESIFCVVDLHAVTVWQDPRQLADQSREITAAFLAAGINPQKSVLFLQSQVPEHTALGWIFACVARLGWLSRMTQFKDKAGKDRERASLGLFAYPALQAADILLYKATHVPVGEDQKQHIELARDIAQKFNHDFGKEVFPLCEPVITGREARIMSLRDGRKKMSKSDPSPASRLDLMDDADVLIAKIRKAKTDPHPLPDLEGWSEETEDFSARLVEARPEATALLSLFSALAQQPLKKVLVDWQGQNFSRFKKALGELSVEVLVPIGKEMRRLMSEQEEVDSVLRNGAERARTIACPVLDEVYETVGFLRPRKPT